MRLPLILGLLKVGQVDGCVARCGEGYGVCLHCNAARSREKTSDRGQRSLGEKGNTTDQQVMKPLRAHLITQPATKPPTVSSVSWVPLAPWRNVSGPGEVSSGVLSASVAHSGAASPVTLEARGSPRPTLHVIPAQAPDKSRHTRAEVFTGSQDSGIFYSEVPLQTLNTKSPFS